MYSAVARNGQFTVLREGGIIGGASSLDKLNLSLILGTPASQVIVKGMPRAPTGRIPTVCKVEDPITDFRLVLQAQFGRPVDSPFLR